MLEGNSQLPPNLGMQPHLGQSKKLWVQACLRRPHLDAGLITPRLPLVTKPPFDIRYTDPSHYP